MQTFTLVRVKLIFLKNLVIILFQSFFAYFNLYKLFIILQTNFFDLLNIFKKFLYKLIIYFG